MPREIGAISQYTEGVRIDLHTVFGLLEHETAPFPVGDHPVQRALPYR